MPVVEQRPKILIVEDEKVNLDVLVGLLSPHYRITIAKNGEQALKLLEKQSLPDLILLDIIMPGMNGYEVCRKIKQNPLTKHIAVIFITGRTDEKDEAMGFKAGAVDYITKPFSSLIVSARVKTHLELKKRGDILERLAGIDGLTGIPNRRQFDRVLASEWNRSLRHRHELALILLDIDCFKQYNDHYGHTEGDECLKQVARTIIQSLPRQEDLAARYGGEEFACILAETDEIGALAVADRIVSGVRKRRIPHACSEVNCYLTVSIGVAAMIPAVKDQVVELVKKADKALYQAKRNGRDQIVCYEKDNL